MRGASIYRRGQKPQEPGATSAEPVPEVRSHCFSGLHGRFPFGRGLVTRLLLAAVLLCGAGSASAASVTLTWDTPADPVVAGVIIHYGTKSGKYTKAISAGHNNSVTITGLVNGQTYYFAATTYDAQGLESEYSNETSLRAGQTVNITAFQPFVGGYNGLFLEPGQVRSSSAGAFSLLVTRSGSCSGRLQLGSSRLSWSGRIDAQGALTAMVRRANLTPLTVQLQIGKAGQVDTVAGTVTEGTWLAQLAGNRARFNTRTNPAPFAGLYTIFVPGQPDTPSLPAGTGFGSVRVSAGGIAAVAGTLGDGTKFTQSAPLSQPGAWPFYLSLAAGRGMMIGWLTFNKQPASDLDGWLTWFKAPGGASPLYPAGFSFGQHAVGGRYLPPPPSQPPLALANATVTFTGGDLGAGFQNSIAFNPPSGNAINLSANPLSLTFRRASGTFSGRVTSPGTGQALRFSGAVLQAANAGYGLLLGSDQSSQVTLSE